MAAPPAAAKATTAEARERGVLARAALLRGNGEWISGTGLAQRKAYLAAKVRRERGVVCCLFFFCFFSSLTVELNLDRDLDRDLFSL